MNPKTQEINYGSSQKEDANGDPEVGGTPVWYPFLTFSIDFVRFEVFLGFSVRVLRGDSILASVLIRCSLLARGNQKLRPVRGGYRFLNVFYRFCIVKKLKRNYVPPHFLFFEKRGTSKWRRGGSFFETLFGL